jgi:hypothetical protein
MVLPPPHGHAERIASKAFSWKSSEILPVWLSRYWDTTPPIWLRLVAGGMQMSFTEVVKAFEYPETHPCIKFEQIREPTVSLRPMTFGGEVVEDYRHVGLTLRQHPASFLRADRASRRIVTCLDAMNARDGKWLTTAGLVLVRQNRGPQTASCSQPSRTRPALPTS